MTSLTPPFLGVVGITVAGPVIEVNKQLTRIQFCMVNMSYENEAFFSSHESLFGQK